MVAARLAGGLTKLSDEALARSSGGDCRLRLDCMPDVEAPEAKADCCNGSDCFPAADVFGVDVAAAN